MVFYKICHFVIIPAVFLSVQGTMWQFNSLIKHRFEGHLCLRDFYGNLGSRRNWCKPSLRGSGTTIDALDTCCKVHTLCYRENMKNGCKSASFRRFDSNTYVWTQEDVTRKIHCRDGTETCKYKMCKCDLDATDCFVTYVQNLKPIHTHPWNWISAYGLFG